MSLAVNHRPLIAVIDDDASACKALSRLLHAVNMDVLSYCSALDFLENGESHNPDCLVLDIHMPGMSGIELRDHLHGHARPIPVVFITAHDEADVLKKAQDGGAAECFLKPVDDRALIGAIERALCHKERKTRNGASTPHPATAAWPTCGSCVAVK